MSQQLALPLQEPETLSAAQLRALHSLFRKFGPQLRLVAAHCPCFVRVDSPSGDALLLSGVAARQRATVMPSGMPAPEGPSPAFSSARDHRLAWASELVGRDLDSFAALTSSEAATLIDSLKRALGQEVRPPRSRRRPDREQAHAYGTAGRRNASTKEIRLVDAATLKLIDDLIGQLGWTQERLQGFLRSRVSPVRSGAIRTLPEANRVIWALKNMIRRADSPASAKPQPTMRLSVAEESNTNEEKQEHPTQPEACSSAACPRTRT